MIKQFLAIAAVATAGLLAAPKAEAGHSSHSSHTYRSGTASCGCPTYTRRFVRSYDRYRRPIFGYTRLDFRHGSSCNHRGHHAASHRGHHHGHDHARHYSRSHGPSISINRNGFQLHIGSHRGYSHGRRGR